MDRLILPAVPSLRQTDEIRIRRDYERFRDTGLPNRVEAYLMEAYGIDVSSRYGLTPIKNPFGKAAGQLSLNEAQVRTDAQAGLGFVVLKTVIAENGQGHRGMEAWAVKDTRMKVEPIVGKETGDTGWNVTWHGRGWHGSFAEYLSFFAASLRLGREWGTVVVPSCKYHLPAGGDDFALDEYRHTTQSLAQVWRQFTGSGPLQMEKDFSPTLAGLDRAKQQETILRWYREVPKLIQSTLLPGELQLGIKLMNTVFDDDFQLRTMTTLIEEGEVRPDYLIYANRLYDHAHLDSGKSGVAYGGPDLSRRNLRLLSRLRRLELEGELTAPVPGISGTGDVHSGKMALEYALRGAESVQMHTLFQLPSSAYGMTIGNKTERALHELYFHPVNGLVTWMLHLRETGEIGYREGIASFREVTTWYRERGRDFFMREEHE